MQIQVATIVPVTQAEGPGRRFAIWVQGCPLRCPGCCNPEMLPRAGGTAIEIDALACDIESSAAEHAIEGITLLGGEPFALSEPASMLARQTQDQGLSVMVFSGFTLDELRARADRHVSRLLHHTDILVDGPYRRELPDTTRRWIGSTNQRVHFLSDRYQRPDDCWRQSNTLEIRLRDGEVTVNGFPAKKAECVWKRFNSQGPWRSSFNPQPKAWAPPLYL